MDTAHDEIILKGTPLSDGIAIGTGHVLAAQSESVPEFTIPSIQAESEVDRYRKALKSSREELLSLQTYLAHEGSDDASTIIDTHIQMLDDPLITAVEDRIRQQLQNTESVFRSVISEYEEQFSKVDNSFFRQRLIDVKDLSQRIMWHLRCKHKKELEQLPKNSVLISEEIVPSDAAEALRIGVLAFVTHLGGATSHAALIAKSRGIPYVANIDLEDYSDVSIKHIIVDGIKGEVILNPQSSTLARYRLRQEELNAARKKQHAGAHLPSMTTDGQVIDVMANIERVDDVDQLKACGAAGIGLFRSEYLFLQEDSASSEERQEAVYRQILQAAKDVPVTFRLFDVGGDKDFSPTFTLQVNPALGCRAIRFLMQRPAVFEVQVRALLRAGAGTELRILLPLISDIEEIRQARQIIFAQRDHLANSGTPLPTEIYIGAMMEVPSALLMADILASEVDFFSIGTNDLTQYTLAVDRADSRTYAQFQAAHPSVLRLIRHVAESSKTHKIPLSVCGDLAADPFYTQLLIGLGVRQLSCPPRYIPAIKEAVRATTLKNAEILAEQALKLTGQDAVNQLIKCQKASRPC